MSASEAELHGPSTAPSLGDLVTHFVAAKRSLSATNHVYEANEIVEDARKLAEVGAVLHAKNAYLERGVEGQVNVLKNIYSGLEAVGHEAQIDFQGVIKSLDHANDRLQGTLAALRRTIVNTALSEQSYKQEETSSRDMNEDHTPQSRQKNTLYDFIDESTHTTLLDSLRATIDSYNDAQADLQKPRTALQEAMSEISSSLAQDQGAHKGDGQGEDDGRTLIPDLFNSLSSNASEMASLLQSLISHYDLCIFALKHTEGGGEAARAATSTTDPLIATGAESPTEASLYAGAEREAHRIETITNEERDEMLSVLTHDAAQVSDVVADIRAGLASMRTAHSTLEAKTSSAKARFALLSSLISNRLTSISSTLLPSCAIATSTFKTRWVDLRASLVSQTEALTDLSRFHDAFLASYASLLREVERRRAVETKMEKIAGRAMKEIEALRAEDEDMRGQFVKEVGEWLPSDIWPGLGEGARGWRLVRDGEGGDTEGDDHTAE